MYKLFIGDDTSGQFNRKFYITPHTGLDLTGCVAQFTLQGSTKTLTDLTDGVAKQVVFSRAETMNMKCGVSVAKLVVIDSTGRFRTCNNNILVLCSDSVDEVYRDPDYKNNIEFSLGMGINLKLVDDNPFFGVTTDISTEDGLRGVVATLVEMFGGKVNV